MDQLANRKEKARIVVKELKQLFPKAQTILRYSNNLELLVAVMLSAQTTDVQVNKVTDVLFKKYRSVGDYLKVDIAEFEHDIQTIGLYKSKAKNILATMKILQEKFHGQLPKTSEEMIQLPGVGRKTANVVLGIAYGVVEGIAVDTHVRRLAKKFGLTDHTDPAKIEQDLMQILPKKEWHDFTFRIIDYGRKYSPARMTGLDDPISHTLQQLQ